jgi:hypothetical protein
VLDRDPGDGLRPDARRSDGSKGLTSESELGGFGDLFECLPSRDSNSVTGWSVSRIRVDSSTINSSGSAGVPSRSERHPPSRDPLFQRRCGHPPISPGT